MNKYDLEERTLKFSIELTKLIKTLPKNQVNDKAGNQVIGSGTSIGANYREANGAESRKDFTHKIRICLKESKETDYWLKILKENNESQTVIISELWKEAHEFSCIFGKIVSTMDKDKVKELQN